VSAGENVLSAALAAGIPLPHSCRAGRCATCKALLLSGEIAYPDDRLPPGIVAAEAAHGEVLLCQARPRSDLSIQSRRSSVRAADFVDATLLAVDELPSGTVRVRIKISVDVMGVRPGQYVDAKNPAGQIERVAVVVVRGAELELELDRVGPLGEWVSASPVPGTTLGISGPFENVR
jgi:CDP-4-dehydro-6-deoxyglucose reductase, E3